MSEPTVTLFTPEEHVVIAGWLGRHPVDAVADDLTPDRALAGLGFTKEPELFSRVDAAVGALVVENIQARLPQWACVDSSKEGDERYQFARDIRAPAADRGVLIRPTRLFTIDWAWSGPGMSWPAAYHVAWLPLYDVYVVTESYDSPECYGYCDFALGWFDRRRTILAGSREVLIRSWFRQRMSLDQEPWECFFSSGLVSRGQAEAWRARAWSELTFKCPQCGSDEEGQGVSISPSPDADGPWSCVLAATRCVECGYMVPDHLGYRWWGISFASAQRTWRRDFMEGVKTQSQAADGRRST